MAINKINIGDYEVTEKKIVEFFKKEHASFYYNESTMALYTRCPDERRYSWIGYARKRV